MFCALPKLVKISLRAHLLVAVAFLAPHTSELRDVPYCGALSLLQKTLHYRGGGSSETAATLNVKLCVLVVVVVVVVVASYRFLA